MTIEEIFNECFDIETEKVTDELKYREIEKWDSLNHLKMTNRLEEVFDIELDMDEIIEMSSVGKIKEILRGYGVEA
ncbi:MAG: acyl carrier protein [Calditrichota bacterium]